MRQDACPGRDALAAFATGKISGKDFETLAAHLDGCPCCLSTLQELDRVTQLLPSRCRSTDPLAPFMDEAGCHAAVARYEIVGFGQVPPTNARNPVIDQYRLGELIGRGSMGVVYRAEHVLLGRMVAIKVLPADRLRHPEHVARFLREAAAVGRVHHPNVVLATDAGMSDGVPYLVMEYVEGVDLARHVRDCGVLSVAAACAVVRQAALGLHAAHEHGIVHRDVKPSNLLLSTTGEVKVLDLGLALFLVGPESDSVTTEPGVILGSLDYMAPEQAADPRVVDRRADLYSLGCTLYYLLTGSPPFPGPRYRSMLEKIKAHRSEPVPPPRPPTGPCPESIRVVLDRLLAKDPTRRFGSAAEVAEALAPLSARDRLADLLTLRTADPPPSPGEQFGGSGLGGIRRRVAAGFFGAILLLAGVLFFTRLKGTDGRSNIEITTRVDVDLTDNSLSYAVDGKPVTADELSRPVELRAGEHEFVVRRAEEVRRRVTFRVSEDAGNRFEIISDSGPVKKTAGPSGDNHDRRAAAWVLGQRGRVSVQVSTAARLPISLSAVESLPLITREEDLPKTAFRLIAASLGNGAGTDDNLNRLQGVPLMGLWLVDSPITDRGLLALARQRELKALQLDGTRITDAGLAHLAGSRLEVLHLIRTRVHGTGVHTLRPLHLHTLHIGSEVTDAGLESIGRLREIRTLTIVGRFTDTGFRHLNALDLRWLEVDTPGLTDDGLRTLQELADLEHLRINGTQLTDEGLGRMRGLAKLSSPGLVRTRVTDAGLSRLKNFPALSRLELSGGMFTDAGLRHLAAVPGLRRLWLNDTQVGDAGIGELTRMKGLTHLSLVGSRVSDTGLRRLKKALPDCHIEPATR